MIPRPHQTGDDVTHERKDADVINLMMIALLLVLIIAICLMICAGVLHFLNRGRETKLSPRAQMTKDVASFPVPQLIEHSGDEWKKTQSVQRKDLESYGWIDRPAGIVRIPIDRAMQLLVERGLPAAGAGQTRLQLMQSRPQTDVQPNEPIVAPAPGTTP